ncbi:MAG TPA: EAL domain-containing protein [Steroidobacteraceae bacterium]|jgi:diguanylate cyclase (GGDEF)-like protein/PAS domain S-box-containing protein|nr:EAL domain-containing protein [Steroidobacteraceae bacterium]
MNSFIATIVTRWARPLFLISVVYSAVCVLFMVTGWGGAAVAEYIGVWGSFPVSAVICVVLWPTMIDATLSWRRRLAWRLIFAALMLDLVASVGWGYSALTENVTFGSWPDLLYIFYYPLAALAFALLYVDLGGRIDTPRSIIDFTTVAIGFGSLLWFTALAPVAGLSGAEMFDHWSVIGYGVGDAIALVAAAMLAMQITDWRAERPIVWLLIAMVVTLVSDLLWINAELRGTYKIGGASDVGYFVFYLCMFAAAHYQLGHRRPGASTFGLQGDLRGSLPIVALMVGTIALLDDRLNLATAQSPLLIWVLVAATLLVVAGQAFATREVVGLHREVATRRFDERLTELVRRSSDMIAICDTGGTIRYASPSSEQLLGVAPGELAGQRLDDVLGPEAAHVREVFDQVTGAAHSEQIANFAIPQSGGEKRSFKMVIANLCHVESIRGITLNIRDISDATRLHDQLRTLAFHDSLTLLANRSLFSDRVHQAIRHVADGMTPAVLFIDLDNFKTVNDSLGHSAGDQLLRSFAHRLVQCTRAGDTVARLGGDEFAVLIDHAPNIDAAVAVARQVLDACRQPFEIDGRPLRIGCSVGVALADRVSNVERLLRNADAAMYAAKSRGKGHAEIFQPEMLRAARRRMRIENELAAAIDGQQLEAHYQPIVDLNSRHLVGIEALMRWRHPTRGLVMPGDFIPLAEETGQIVPMTQWILDRACADVARLQREIPHGAGLRISVNVSSRYLNHGNIVEDVRNSLAKHQVEPACLILEVTESLLLENSSRLERTFQELKRIGVRLALDDFGTGYSSLAYLHRFPIDILKIDRSFVERLAGEGEGAGGVDAVALARAILSLADALGLDTVAEGIEHDAQRDTLLELGCKTGQGYSFGKAMPVEEVLDAAVTRRRSMLAGNAPAQVEYSATGRFRGIADKG